MNALKITLLAIAVLLAAAITYTERYIDRGVADLRWQLSVSEGFSEQWRRSALEQHAQMGAIIEDFKKLIQQEAVANQKVAAVIQQTHVYDSRVAELKARLTGVGGDVAAVDPAGSTLRTQPSAMLVRLSSAPEEIALKDGRVFRDAKIISQTATVVTIQYPGGGVSIPKSLLAEQFLTEFPNTEGAAIGGDALGTSNPMKVTVTRQAPNIRREVVSAHSPTTQASEEMQAANDRALLDAITKKARAYAEHYFRYDYLAGISGAIVTRLDINLEEPTPVTGWPNRYAVEGRCALEYYESATVNFNKTVADAFTITVEGTGSQAKVVDFSKHYTPR